MIELLLAEQWGIPPWEIEDKVPDLWVQRWIAFQNERNRPEKKDSLI